MTEEKYVIIAEEGEYSDYTWEAVAAYDDRETAEQNLADIAARYEEFHERIKAAEYEIIPGRMINISVWDVKDYYHNGISCKEVMELAESLRPLIVEAISLTMFCYKDTSFRIYPIPANLMVGKLAVSDD